MSKIFISYRRQDSRPVATLIYDPLAKHFEAKFGAGAVFMDVHGIPLGVNFRCYLNEQVGKAELLLALIADRWLTAVDEHGARRIDGPNDFVRIEIEAALKRGVPVVPVYVDDAKVLREAELPVGLKDLAWMNGFQLRTDARYFAADAARLIAGLEPHLSQSQPEADNEVRSEKYTVARYLGSNAAAPIAALEPPPPPVADELARVVKYVRSAMVYHEKGEYDHAIADYDQAIGLGSNLATAYREGGSAIMSETLAGVLATAYRGRGIAFNWKREYDRTIADYDQAIRLAPKDAAVYHSRGSAYNSKGDYDRAIADFDHAIRLDPKSSGAYYSRGVAFCNKSDFDRAIADYDQAIRLDPKSLSAYNNRGVAYGNKGDYDRAIADYDRALAIEPSHQLAAENKRIAEEVRARQNKKKGWFG